MSWRDREGPDMRSVHDPLPNMLQSLGDILRGLGRLEEGQRRSHEHLWEHSQRLRNIELGATAIEQRTRVIERTLKSQGDQISANRGSIDDMRRSSMNSPETPRRYLGLTLGDWVRLGSAAAIVIMGLIAQIPLDKLAAALAAFSKGG